MAEFPNVGETCFVTSCRQLDFLPFECDFCHKIFCAEHRNPENHGCSRPSVITSMVDKIPGHRCSFESCNNRELVEIPCQFCEKNFCLQHRFANDHECDSLNSNAKPITIINRDDISLPQPPKCRGCKSEKTTAKVKLMKLKMKAVGDKSVPLEKRMYFDISLPKKKNGIDVNQAYFFSKEWSIGKIIDFIADKEKIPNFNNKSSNKKLHLIVSEDGLILPTQDILESLNVDEGCNLTLTSS